MRSFALKLALWLALAAGYAALTGGTRALTQDARAEAFARQLDERAPGHAALQLAAAAEQHLVLLGWLALGAGALCTLLPAVCDGLAWLGRPDPRRGLPALGGLALALLPGCWRPFEPVKLEVVKPNEEAILIPYTGDAKKQSASNNEEYLRQNLVYVKQVQIPQQWVAKGYGHTNGEWQDAAVLMKVDKSPVTREWTADPNSGTSNKNEAIWVMTSDQVEFSTGWTCTARIGTQDDAVKFLHNYPNGTLAAVLDSEVRGKLQAEFGLEVTDLPMETLRNDATPHLKKVVASVSEFFKGRGVTITNLGITGGFVYKDKSIADTLVKVFNAEQERAVAKAATAAQEERNKAVILKAQGEADAIMKTKKAEADAVKMLAEAKLYELDKAKADFATYAKLKQLELQRDLLQRWDGSYPRYFFGGQGGAGTTFLMPTPQLDEPAPAKK